MDWSFLLKENKQDTPSSLPSNSQILLPIREVKLLLLALPAVSLHLASVDLLKSLTVEFNQGRDTLSAFMLLTLGQ